MSEVVMDSECSHEVFDLTQLMLNNEISKWV